MRRLIILLFGVGIGVTAIRFRHEIRERAAIAAGKAKGAVANATPSPASEDVDDKTLAHKVETEIFRAPDAPKGDVTVDVQRGVAHLRGEVSDERWISRLGEEAEKVDGVKGVENLLHRPGTPAPAAAPRGTVTERSS
jgi:osmotically-inducible protein OsmY